MNKLVFSGERYVPEVHGQIEIEHLHRYALAIEIAKDKDVLDIASGEGYGSHLLSSVARSVIGVDISRETIEHSRKKYEKNNLIFKVGSACKIPLEDSSVDVIGGLPFANQPLILQLYADKCLRILQVFRDRIPGRPSFIIVDLLKFPRDK